ncbi:MAG: hypothetical protein QMD08_05815 [Actinomycetota bacterium]|nr:hypothetical protein [Actinomycetota bacterium]
MTSKENSSSFLQEITEQDVMEWYEEMIVKINVLKEEGLKMAKKGVPQGELDDRNKDLIRRVIYLRKSKQRRKREIKELMDNIKKESNERRNEWQKLQATMQKVREEHTLMGIQRE